MYWSYIKQNDLHLLNNVVEKNGVRNKNEFRLDVMYFYLWWSLKEIFNEQKNIYSILIRLLQTKYKKGNVFT